MVGLHKGQLKGENFLRTDGCNHYETEYYEYVTIMKLNMNLGIVYSYVRIPKLVGG